MTEKTEVKKKKLSLKTYLWIGVIFSLAIHVLYVFTALALIALGLWAGVVWVWYALFTLRLLYRQFVLIFASVVNGEPVSGGYKGAKKVIAAYYAKNKAKVDNAEAV